MHDSQPSGRVPILSTVPRKGVANHSQPVWWHHKRESHRTRFSRDRPQVCDGVFEEHGEPTHVCIRNNCPQEVQDEAVCVSTVLCAFDCIAHLGYFAQYAERGENLSWWVS